MSCGTLWPLLGKYQQEIVERVLSKKTFAIFAEQGTGKTWITAGVIDRLQQSNPEFIALVIVPLANVESTWAALLRKYVQVSRSFDDFKTWQKQWNTPQVLLLHYEALNKKLIVKLRKIQWTLIVYDESQRLKQRGSRTSRNAALLSASGEYRIALSGTPMDKAPSELWAQFRFVNPDVLGKRWTDFEASYFPPINIDPSKYRRGSALWARAIKLLQIKKSKQDVDPAKLPELMSRLAPWSVRVTKEEVLDLPPLHYITHTVVLRGKQRRYYDEMEDDLVIPSLGLMATLRITQITRLQQITGGFVPDEFNDYHFLGSAKARKVVALMKRVPGPHVIACRFREEMDFLLKLFAHKRPEAIRGGTKNRADIIKRFQAGQIQLLIIQVKAGGVGIDLYRASEPIIYSWSRSFIDFDQLVSRFHRRGQTRPVNVHLLVAQETIDIPTSKSILSKESATSNVLDYLRNRRQMK